MLRTTRTLALASLLGLLAALLPPPVLAGHSATFVVSTTADAPDAAPGDDVCATATGECTLRAAVMEANAAPDANAISLQAPAPAVYSLSIAGSSENASRVGDLDVVANLVIEGRSPAEDVIDATGAADRAIEVLGPGVSFSLRKVSLTGGNAGSGDGGALLSAGVTSLEEVFVKDSRARSGGGVSSSGILTLHGSRLTGNVATLQGGGLAVAPSSSPPGDGVILRMTRSGIDGNFSQGVGGGVVAGPGSAQRIQVEMSSVTGNAAQSGGGLYLASGDAQAPSVVSNTTFGANDASEISCSDVFEQQVCNPTGRGGGVFNSGHLVLSSVTVARNKANLEGGGLVTSTSGSTAVKASLMADNTGSTGGPDNCAGALPVSEGANLESPANDCGFDSGPGPDADGDIVGGAAGLGPLTTETFGVTRFFPLEPGSDAIDAAPCDAASDQLAQPRPSGAGCEIGAIELYETPAECAIPGAVCGTGGDDQIEGTDGDDLLVGGPGNDTIVCGEGTDTVIAGEGNDMVDCGPGDDVIDGGPGDDLIYAGRGNDEVRAGDGQDTIFGDTRQTSSLRSAAGAGGNDLIFGEGGGDLVFAHGARDRLRGGGGTDRLWGGGEGDEILGQGGRDKLYGEAGSDELDGGEDADELRAGSGDDDCVVGRRDRVVESCERQRRAHRRAH